MTSCIAGKQVHLAKEDFELVLPTVELTFGSLVPRCRCTIIALSGPRLSDGVLLYWHLEARVITATLVGCKSVVVDMTENDECVHETAQETNDVQEGL